MGWWGVTDSESPGLGSMLAALSGETVIGHIGDTVADLLGDALDDYHAAIGTLPTHAQIIEDLLARDPETILGQAGNAIWLEYDRVLYREPSEFEIEALVKFVAHDDPEDTQAATPGAELQESGL